MRTIEVNLYQFEELSDKAKGRARQWYRDCSAGDNTFAEPVIEEAIEIGKRLGVSIAMRSHQYSGGKTRTSPCVWWSGFWNQGDGASFEGSYKAADQSALVAIKDYAPKDEKLHAIAQRLDALQGKYDHRLTANISRNDQRYCHAYTMQIDASVTTAEDDDVAVPVEDERELLHAFRDFANWIYRELEDAYNFDSSDEHVDEMIRINEYEFYADGRRADA